MRLSVPFGKLLVVKNLRRSILGSGHNVAVGCVQLAVDLMLLCWLVLRIGRKPLIKPALLISHLKFSIEDCIQRAKFLVRMLRGVTGCNKASQTVLGKGQLQNSNTFPSMFWGSLGLALLPENAGPALWQYCNYQEVTLLSFLCASMATWTRKWRNKAGLGLEVLIRKGWNDETVLKVT